MPSKSRFAFHVLNDRVSFPPDGAVLRLWGLQDDVEGVPSELLEPAFRCRVVGSAQEEMKARTLAVICDQADKDLAKQLIDGGYASENCVETLGAFETCGVRD
jgi:hypothetical protein